MKQALQGLIMEIKSPQGELDATSHWITFLQVDENLSPIWRQQKKSKLPMQETLVDWSLISFGVE